MNKPSQDMLDASLLYNLAITMRARLDMYSDAAIEAAYTWPTDAARDPQDAEIALLFGSEIERRKKETR